MSAELEVLGNLKARNERSLASSKRKLAETEAQITALGSDTSPAMVAERARLTRSAESTKGKIALTDTKVNELAAKMGAVKPAKK